MNTRDNPVAAFLTGLAVTGLLAGALFAVFGELVAGVFVAILVVYALLH